MQGRNIRTSSTKELTDTRSLRTAWHTVPTACRPDGMCTRVPLFHRSPSSVPGSDFDLSPLRIVSGVEMPEELRHLSNLVRPLWTVSWNDHDHDPGMPKSNAGKLNTFPLVTACETARSLSTSSLEFTESTIAHLAAVPVPVTVPLVTATVVIFRPFGVRAAGPVNRDRPASVARTRLGNLILPREWDGWRPERQGGRLSRAA